MMAATGPLDLDWHHEWVTSHAQERAVAAYLEMAGTQAVPDEDGLLIWERRGLELAGVVRFGMDGLETPEFSERAQLVAIEIFLRRLHELLSTTPMGGAA